VAASDQACGNCGYTWGSEPFATATSLNRRRDERYSAELRVHYVSARRQVEATTLDISVRGMFACMEDIDPVGTKCTVTIFTDERAAVRVAGIVRRTVDPGTAHPALVGVGIELVELGEPERAWLETLVVRLADD